MALPLEQQNQGNVAGSTRHARPEIIKYRLWVYNKRFNKRFRPVTGRWKVFGVGVPCITYPEVTRAWLRSKGYCTAVERWRV